MSKEEKIEQREYSKMTPRGIKVGATWLAAPRITRVDAPSVVLADGLTRIRLGTTGWGWMLVRSLGPDGEVQQRRHILPLTQGFFAVDVRSPAVVTVTVRNPFGSERREVRLLDSIPPPGCLTVTMPRTPLVSPIPRFEVGFPRIETSIRLPNGPSIGSIRMLLPPLPSRDKFMEYTE